ncbi:sensor histidine kinase [Streptomyces sp. NPDC091387]|uniref:sensor histidine kinase n=1 Tax=Streptomyces sp. NPDC091387 TaxID=3365998 RepID=UPI00381D4C88
MGKIRGLLLPGAFTVTQLALWVWEVPALGEPPGPAAWITAFVATAAAAHALERRNRAPLQALGQILGSSVLVQVLAPPDTLSLVASVAVLISLYSVSARCGWGVALAATAAALGVQLLLGAVQYGPGSALLSHWLFDVPLYLPAAALGAGRRRRLRERQVASRRLTRAEQELRQAADAERHRLAGELHDISAHHLTSVVVSVEAARRLGDSRPELTAEALGFARRTARETQVALRRLVAVMRVDETRGDELAGPQPMAAAIDALIAGFGRLGRPVSVSLPADLDGPAAEAAHGIIREALTNALRYASGAAVSVRAERDGEALYLTVDNSAPSGGNGDGDGLRIGSGRGLDGMGRRAAAVGGHLSAGPRADGGWRVRAVLPDAGPARESAGGRRRDFPREQRIADAVVCGSTVVASWAYGLGVTVAADAGHGAPSHMLLALLLTVHALPLLWRRRAPWAALAAVGATAAVWPVLVTAGVLPSSAPNVLLGGGFVELAAVYGVAAYGRVLRPVTTSAGRYVRSRAAQMTIPSGYRLSFLAVPAAAFSFAVSMTTAFAGDGRLLGDATDPFTVLFVLTGALLVFGTVFTAAWWAGWLMHMRRRRAIGREDATFRSLQASTRNVVHGERQRVAGGLQETVLEQTTLVIASAEAGSLNDVATTTRATLAAMRQLLGSLDAGRAPAAPRDASAEHVPRE